MDIHCVTIKTDNKIDVMAFPNEKEAMAYIRHNMDVEEGRKDLVPQKAYSLRQYTPKDGNVIFEFVPPKRDPRTPSSIN